MKTILNRFVVALAACAWVAGLSQALEGWSEDLDAALADAAKDKRTLLVEFTGSDWCPPCMHLRAKVLPSPEFAEFVQKNQLVLVELDYPNDQSKVTPEQAAARQQAAERYGVDAYPTMLVMDTDGRPYGRVVGGSSTAAEYIARLQELIDAKAAFDERVKAAEGLSGAARAAALAEALNSLDPAARALRTDIVEDILKNDPEDKTGFKKQQEQAALFKEQMREVEESLAKFHSRDIKTAAPEIREELLQLLKREDWLPEVRLLLNQTVGGTYMIERNMPQALQYMKAALESAPDSAAADELRPMVQLLEASVGSSAPTPAPAPSAP